MAEVSPLMAHGCCTRASSAAANTVAAIAIALDARGNVYVGGYTQTTASPGALAVADPNGCEYVINIGPSVDESYNYIDGFVMKLAPNGAPPAFFATIGGGCSDRVQSLSLDGSGNIWVSGTTISADFPTRAPIGALGVGQGGFAAEIDPSGSSLLFSTLSGSAAGIAPAVAATRTGAYLASSIADPSKPGAAAALAGFIDGGQAPAIALDSIQTPSITPQRLPPIFIPPTIAPGQLLVLKGRGIGPSATVNAKLTAGGAFPATPRMRRRCCSMERLRRWYRYRRIASSARRLSNSMAQLP